ncbi:hypothetical protein [Thermogutta sp.]|uniref:hypothetical protein n=1 Tax=Thermogutta sp. TaxID=1962930 RepID=UPI00321F7688
MDLLIEKTLVITPHAYCVFTIVRISSGIKGDVDFAAPMCQAPHMYYNCRYI